MDFRAIPLSVPDAARRGGFHKAELRLDGIYPPEHQAMLLRAFLNLPDADETTAFPEHPRFAGRAAIMARPRYRESVEQGKVPWADPAAPLVEPDPPINVRFDVTDAFRSLAKTDQHFDLTIVVTDMSNRPLPDETLELERIELRFYD